MLINMTGTTITYTEITKEDWEKVFGVNLKAMLFTWKVFGKSMIKNGGGRGKIRFIARENL